MATVAGTDTTYTDGTAPLVGNVIYRVSASNLVGEGAASNDDCSAAFPWDEALLGCPTFASPL